MAEPESTPASFDPPISQAPPALGAEPDALLEREALQRRARRGVLLLAARTVVQQLTVLGGNVVLARVLGPGEFGVFWIVQFVLSFFMLFGDVGLGAALVQKREMPSQDDLSSVFWAAFALAGMVVLVVFVAAPWVVRLWPDLPPTAPWLLRALSLGLLLTALRALPSVLMERELLFGRLAVIDLALTLTFYGVAAPMAVLGFGVGSLIAASLSQGVVGLVLAYALRPWRPSFRVRRDRLRPIVSFGIAFQAKGVVGFLNSAVIPLYAGGALGKVAFGLVSWSQTTAAFPLRIVEILGRVSFPLFSRLQHDEKAFADALSRTIHICSIATLLFCSVFFGLGPQLIQVIYGDKWMPAVPTFYVFTVGTCICFFAQIIGAALDAIGRPQVIMRLAVGWTALNWLAIYVVMQLARTPMAFSLAYSVHTFAGNAAVVLVVRKLVPKARFFARMIPAYVATALTSLVAIRFLRPVVAGWPTLVLAIVATLALFIGVVGVLDREGLSELWGTIRPKKPRVDQAGAARAA